MIPIIAALGLLAACETTSPSTAQGNTRPPGWISLERTDDGRSLYVVTLFEDGRAILETLSPTRRRTLSKTIPPDATQRVFNRLETVDFWSREARYDVERVRQGNDSVISRTASPDGPWDILRAQRRSRIKRIDGLFFAPPELIDLKALVEQTVGLEAWLAEANRP